MSWNDIDDDGMSLVVEGLQYNNTLTKLNVERCGFSGKGIELYKTELKAIWSLQMLYSQIWSSKIKLR